MIDQNFPHNPHRWGIVHLHHHHHHLHHINFQCILHIISVLCQMPVENMLQFTEMQLCHLCFMCVLVWGVFVYVCACVCVVCLSAFVSTVGSHEMERHKLPIIIIICF